MKHIKYTKLKEYPNSFQYVNLVVFYNQRSYYEKISKKQQSQVQTIQRPVTSRSV